MARPHKQRSQRRRDAKAAGSTSRSRSKTYQHDNIDLTRPIRGVVQHVADRGDGLVHAQTTDPDHIAAYFVPGVLAGEVIEFAGARQTGPQPAAGQLLSVIEPAEGRALSPCPHVEHCGGCQLQHATPDAIAAIKTARIKRALTQQDLGHITVYDAITAWHARAGGSRRRMEFAMAHAGGEVHFGLHRRQSQQRVDIEACPVSVPMIEQAIPALRAFAAIALEPGEQADCHVTATDDGLDLVLTRKRPPSLDERLSWPGFIETRGWPRLSWRARHPDPPETVVAFTNPTIRIGDHAVPIPAGGFLQARVQGQATLIDQVMRHINAGGEPRQCLDLFAGLGTITLPLLAADDKRQVTAIDMAGSSLESLRAAGTPYGSRLMVEPRDLFRHPLDRAGLKNIDAIIIDPPRAGAEAQVAEIADSAVPLVIAVSCNPVSFARDARALIDGGYTMSPVQPVDQFQWSVEAELVAAFTR